MSTSGFRRRQETDRTHDTVDQAFQERGNSTTSYLEAVLTSRFVVAVTSLLLCVTFSVPVYAACSEDIRALNARMATGKGGELDPQTVDTLEEGIHKLIDAAELCESGDEEGSAELIAQVSEILERVGR